MFGGKLLGLSIGRGVGVLKGLRGEKSSKNIDNFTVSSTFHMKRSGLLA